MREAFSVEAPHCIDLGDHGVLPLWREIRNMDEKTFHNCGCHKLIRQHPKDLVKQGKFTLAQLRADHCPLFEVTQYLFLKCHTHLFSTKPGTSPTLEAPTDGKPAEDAQPPLLEHADTTQPREIIALPFCESVAETHPPKRIEARLQDIHALAQTQSDTQNEPKTHTERKRGVKSPTGGSYFYAGDPDDSWVGNLRNSRPTLWILNFCLFFK